MIRSRKSRDEFTVEKPFVERDWESNLTLRGRFIRVAKDMDECKNKESEITLMNPKF